MLFFRILTLSIFLFFSTFTLSQSESSIFYPMPIHTDGQYITAQQLVMREDGAVWMYDIYGQLHLFDGENIFTIGEKSDRTLPRKIAYFNGEFWFIKKGSIHAWSKKTGMNEVYKMPKGTSIIEMNQQDGMFWGNDTDSFFVYDPKKKRYYSSNINEVNTSAILDEITITGAIHVDNRWLVSTSEGVFEFDIATESYTPLYLGQYIDAIFYSKYTDKIFLGTHGSIWSSELHDHELIINKKILINSSLLSFAETESYFWFGTSDGLYKWNILNNKIDHFTAVVRDDYSLEGNKVYSVIADHNNGLWVATDNGVSYYSDSNRLFSRLRYKDVNGLLNISEINAITQTSENDAWLGTSSGLLLINTDNLYQPIVTISKHSINDLTHGDQFVWAATDKGILQVDPQLKNTYIPKGLKPVEDESIDHLLLSDDDMLWFSSSYGLYKYDIHQDKLVNLGFSWALDQKHSIQITHIYQNKNSQISIGTNVGLYRYENGALTFDYAYVHAGSILDMVDTEYGNSWIVSNYGLQISNSNGVRTDISLPTEYTTPHCVLSSDNGVWLSSSKGLSLYTHRGRIVKHFGTQSGLINNELLPDLCSISPNGVMLFASKDGVIVAHEQELIEYHRPKPHVVLGQIKIDSEIVNYGGEKKLTKQVPYGANISFLFGVLPEFNNKSLSFQLLGSNDEAWQDFDGSLLIFDSLQSGKYELRIKPRNNGQRRSLVTEVEFYVEVPWFFAPWFIFFLFSLVSAILMGIYYWRSKEIKKSNEKLKKSVEIKTKQLSNQGKALISSNRQLQKLLTVRQHVISEMAEQARQPIKDIQANLQKKGLLTNLALANQCEHSLQLLEQLTHIEPFVTLQKNKRTNQVLAPLLSAALKSWKDEYHTKGVDLVLEDNSQGVSIFVQPLLIDAIFNNVLFSLLKRSQSGEVVTIRIQCDGARVAAYFLSEGAEISVTELDELGRVDLSQTIEVINQALGLPAVKLLTVQNGGHFEIVKNMSGSNELQFSWPIAIDEFITPQVPEVHSKDKDSDEQKQHQEWLLKVYQLIEDNYSLASFGTSAAAKALFISERNLQRKFKQLTQRSFMEYLIDTRLEKACELLISGQKVADAAFESGFNDPSYFSKRFKRHYGLSPTQFVTENEE
ncbi:AraC family transcriptional regulator [Aliivibrio fischeri]|uniref:helix-turn-helix domain-containing protein n=1 Tax=Aliivibrio fischeri TaxID=668 RepID=UPI00084C9AB2|nr:helix-turn-helix domain-containing protein [Aliivibrio fischeri]OED57787.1 AraC family transcriptional regulator [Aliivibrio fischeri]